MCLCLLRVAVKRCGVPDLLSGVVNVDTLSQDRENLCENLNSTESSKLCPHHPRTWDGH